jgi:hypothetical protein
MVAARADRQRPAVTRRHRDRRQVTELIAQGLCRRRDQLRDDEGSPGELQHVVGPAAAGLDDRRRRQPGRVEDGVLAGDLGDGATHGQVVHRDGQPYVGPAFVDQQRGLERFHVVALDAQDGEGAGQPGTGEGVGVVGARGEQRDVP